jgi:tRNA threonylcarbamoyladenosine biosynthesis protein TsaB
MILFIDTSQSDLIKVCLKKGGATVAQKTVPAKRVQAEKLLPAVKSLLAGKKVSPDKVTKIVVADSGESFTALRIGVTTANALAYALGIPVENARGGKNKRAKGIEVVEPKYNREPNIMKKHLTIDD